MDHIPVQSSNVRSVGYDEARKTLEVRFHNGGLYAYYGVPKAKYQGLMAASSKGKYLNANIKNRYKYKKIG